MTKHILDCDSANGRVPLNAEWLAATYKATCIKIMYLGLKYRSSNLPNILLQLHHILETILTTNSPDGHQ